MEPNWDFTLGKRGLAVPDKLLNRLFAGWRRPSQLRAHTFRGLSSTRCCTGEVLSAGELDRNKTDYRTATVDSSGPRIVVFCDEGQA
jgi:hypothetical protein